MDPTGSEIQQEETPEYPAIRVQVEGPVKAQLVPALNASMFNRVVTAGAPVQILKKDPRRSRVFLRGIGGTVWLGNVESQATMHTGFQLSATVNIEMFHGDEVWAQADTVDVVVSILQEMWAD